MQEIIQTPNLWIGLRCWENYEPILSHFVVDFSGPLLCSENPIINQLLVLGFEIREAVTSYFFGFPTQDHQLARHFKARETTEFQIWLGKDGWLRIGFEGHDTVYLSLFKIHRDRRGKGLARHHFPRIIDALFRSGVRSVRGKVAPSYDEPADSLNIGKMLRFYVHEAGFTHTGGGHISKSSPYLNSGAKAVHSSL